jgi:DNA-binding beta-propeller fold protein YncE
MRAPGRLLALAVLVAASALAGPALARTAGASDPVAGASIGFQPTPVTLATDPAGNVLFSNSQLSRGMKEYSSGGSLIQSFGVFEGEIRAIATDPAGDVWVLENEARKMIELGRAGNPSRSWSAEGLGMAIAPDGDVYTVGPKGVARYTPDGSLVSTWPLGSGGLGWAIAVGPDGLIYVADSSTDRVEVYEPSGAPVREWTASPALGSSAFPYGIAVSPSGDVYVVETGGDRVDEFTAAGTPIRSWGSTGTGHGQFETPTGIAVGPEGSVYVADEDAEYPGPGTARVQKFTGEGKFVTEFGYLPRPAPAAPRLTARPPRRTTSQAATFSFSSPQKGITFECRLAGRAVPRRLQRFEPCTSPRHYRHLHPGRKVFEVFTLHGHREGGSATYAWTVLGRNRSLVEPGRSNR